MRTGFKQMMFVALSVLAGRLYGQCHYEPITHFYGTETGVMAPSIAFMDTSPDGTIVIAGTYTSSDSIFFGNGWVSPTTDGHYGLFVAKVNLDGSTVWTRTFPGSGFNSVYDVKCDNEGGIYLTGINQAFTIDGELYDGSAIQAFYLCKFDSDGNFDWMVHEEQSSSSGQSISVLESSVFVTGSYSGQLNVLGQTWTAPNSSNVVFVLQVNKDGSYENMYQFMGEGSDQIMEINCNASSCLIAGLYEQSLEFDGQVLGTTSANNEYRFFLSKINLITDEIDWFTSSNESGWIQGVHGVNRDEDFIYLSGFFEDPLSFGSESVTTLGGRDAFVLQIDTNGTVVRLESYGGTDNDGILDASFGNTGLVVSLFYYSSDFIIGDGPLDNEGDEDVLQIVLDDELKEQCFSRFGGDGNDVFWSSIVVGNDIYTLGTTTSAEIEFGQNSLVREGSRDLVLLKSCLSCDTLTSIAETTGAQPALQVYPNPSNTQTQLSYRSPQGTRPTLQLRDMLGRTVQTLQLPSHEGTYTLDAAGLGTGVYFCSLLNGTEVLATEKLSVIRNE